MRSAPILSILMMTLPTLGGCAHKQLIATDFTVEAPATVRIDCLKVKKDVLHFRVYNLSPEVMLVERDRVRLATATGVRARVPGRGPALYQILPGGFHNVFVRFDLRGLQSGEPLEVLFDEALSVRGQRVAVAPLHFLRTSTP